MIEEISKNNYQKVWREFNGSPLQSWQWGQLKSERWEVKRLCIYLKDGLSSVVTIFLRKFPLLSITRVLDFESFAYIPRGIAVKDTKCFRGVLKELAKYFEKKKVAFILLDPDKNFLEKNWNTEFKKALKAEGWEIAGTSIEPNQTNVIEIDKEDEKLFANLKAKWRRNIKKAIRHGVKVSEVCGGLAVDKFYSVISEVEKSTKFKARSKNYFMRMWDLLSEDGLIRIFIATYQEEVVGTYLVLVTENAAYEIYGGSTSKGRDLEASYLLKWEIVRTMRTGGRKYYDQWGVAPKDSDKHPMSGISYFKQGFGGKYVEFLPQYVKIFNKFAFLMYKLLRRVI